MGFSHFSHPDSEEDLRHLIQYFIDEVSLEVGLNFLDAFEDSANRITMELSNHVNRAPRFDDVYGMPIKANRGRNNYAKDFSDYYIWYTILKEKKHVVIWAIESIKREPTRIIHLLKGRRK